MRTKSSNLSEVLQKIRRERGLSLRDFSEVLGISHAYLNKLEKGSDFRSGKPIAPTVDTIVKISDGLDMPIRKFMSLCGYFDRGEMVSEPYNGEQVSIDTEIGALISRMGDDGTSVTIGEAQISKEAKEALCEELRKLLVKIRKEYEEDNGL